MLERARTINFPGDRIVGIVVGLAVVCLGGWSAVEWTVNRIYVKEGYSLQLRYKGPPLPFLPGDRPTVEPGHFAEVEDGGTPLQKGILEEMKGPGRHFYSPFWWERKEVPDFVIEPGQVGLATSKMGENLAKGQFLVDGDLGETKH